MYKIALESVILGLPLSIHLQLTHMLFLPLTHLLFRRILLRVERVKVFHEVGVARVEGRIATQVGKQVGVVHFLLKGSKP